MDVNLNLIKRERGRRDKNAERPFIRSARSSCESRVENQVLTSVKTSL